MRLAYAGGPRAALTAGHAALAAPRAGSVTGLAAAGEFILLLLVAVLFQAMAGPAEAGGRPPAGFPVTAVAGALVIVTANGLAGLYRRTVLFDARRRRGRLAAAAALATMVVMFGTLLSRDGGMDNGVLSPVPLALWFFVSMGLLLGNRWLLSGWLQRQAAAGRFHRTVLVVGSPDGLPPFIQTDDGDGGVTLVGVTGGEDGDLWRTIRDRGVTDVVVAPPATGGAAVGGATVGRATLGRMVRAAGMAPVDVHLLLDAGPGGAPMLVPVARNPARGWTAAVKRGQDVVLTVLLLGLLGPLMVLTAVAVRLDSPGPVLFRQMRTGANNRPFAILKFRTMHVDRADPAGTRRTVRGDPRVTRLGRFLRRTSLDELPQLLNVLRGDMALVGPRAHPVGMLAGDVPYEQAAPEYPARHRVRPGITGLAQINGLRGAVDTVEKGRRRLAYDLLYIDTLSWWLDLTILARTPVCLVKDDNAY